MAIMALVADAVTAELNRLNWSMPFCAVRSYADWKIQLEETESTRNKLFCDVVPVTYSEVSRDSRTSAQYQAPIDICFRKLINPSQRDAAGRTKNQAVDCLVELTEEVFQYFMRSDQRLQAYEPAYLLGQEWVTSYGRLDGAPESMLRINNQFTAVMRLTYGVSVELPNAAT